MAKIIFRPTALDSAIADFLSRMVAEGKQLNYIASYTFDRTVDAPYAVTIRFYADEELSQFGATPPACPACNEVHDPPYQFACNSKAAPTTVDPENVIHVEKL